MTLLSNAYNSLQVWPENNQANFITELVTPLELSTDWEVALTEIHHPAAWRNISTENNKFNYCYNTYEKTNCSVLLIPSPPFTLTYKTSINNFLYSLLLFENKTNILDNFVIEIEIDLTHLEKYFKGTNVDPSNISRAEYMKMISFVFSEVFTTFRNSAIFDLFTNVPPHSASSSGSSASATLHSGSLSSNATKSNYPYDFKFDSENVIYIDYAVTDKYEAFSGLKVPVITSHIQENMFFIMFENDMLQDEQFDVISRFFDLDISNLIEPIPFNRKLNLNDIDLTTGKEFRGAIKNHKIKLLEESFLNFLKTDPDNFIMEACHYPKVNKVECTLKPGYYKERADIISALNQAIPDMHKTNVKFELDTSGCLKIASQNPYKYWIEFLSQNGLADMLGIEARLVDKKFPSIENPIFTSKYPIDTRNGIYSLFVYTDIIENQSVGDSYATLLRIVPIGGASMNVQRFSTGAYYADLKLTHITRIHIILKTDIGQELEFTEGKTYVQLHFRRKNI